jgi:hypothetical protein
MRRTLVLSLLFVLSASILACAQQAQPAQDKSASPSPAATLPLNFERQTGDLDAMVKRGSIRALVLYSRSGFFYVNGQPEGIYYEALQYFEALRQ